MKRRLLLAPAALVLLAAGGGTGYHLTASDADRPLPSRTVAALGASLAERSPTASLVLGRTNDEHGQPHELVLHASGLQQAWQEDNLFAVLSGSNLAVTGDAAVGDWQFVTKSSGTGDRAPIVVLKFARGSMVDLASNPSGFAQPSQYNDDAVETSTRLSALINSVLTRSRSQNDGLYQDLAANLTDPDWMGVMIFNPVVRAVPGTVLGRSTDALAGTQVPAVVIGFQASRVPGGSDGPAYFFAVVDHSATSADGPASGASHLRARFTNSALTAFQISEN